MMEMMERMDKSKIRSIYHENMQRVYRAVMENPLLASLWEYNTTRNVCFLDMQNIFRHCPLKEFHQLHDKFKLQSEALFESRHRFLMKDTPKILHAVVQYYRNKQFPHTLSPLIPFKYIKDNASSYNVNSKDYAKHLWIVVSQKNMKSEKESIVDVVQQEENVWMVFVGCYFFEKENFKNFKNCSQSSCMKNEMDDYALLLLATRFLEASRKNPKQHLFIFSNDKFTKKESVVQLQYYPEKVSFYKYFGP